jgi:peptide/nickel transport system permease protein
MASYIARRLFWAVITLLAISAITFAIFYVLPSADPAKLRAGKAPTADSIAAIREQLGLDQPLWKQFVDYNADLFLHFDFGTSFVTNQDVGEVMFDRLPNTMFLVFGAAILWFVAGVVIGTISATRPGTLADRFLMGGALVAISAPVYWLGLVCLYLFADDIGVFKIFPGAGAYQDAGSFLEKCWALTLPWIVLSAAFAAIYARLLRSNLVEVLGEDYIRTARAKGVPERQVVVRHGVRAAITPVITVLGLDIGILMGGAILTETVFNIDGIGRLSYDAIQRGDLATIQGTTILLAASVAIASLVVDILYAFLDPRVRY